jgi:hypothetical protein
MVALAYGELRGRLSSARTVPRLPSRLRGARGQDTGIGFHPLERTAVDPNREMRRSPHGPGSPPGGTAPLVAYGLLTHSEQSSAPIETVLQRRDGSLHGAIRPRVPLTPRGGVASLSLTGQLGRLESELVQPGRTPASIYPPPEGSPWPAPYPLDHALRPERGIGRRAPSGPNTAKRV